METKLGLSETISSKVQVVQTVTTVYEFPDYPNSRCAAHGDALCVSCARNPGSCVSEMGGCSIYSVSGMHWDTCPNRIR